MNRNSNNGASNSSSCDGNGNARAKWNMTCWIIPTIPRPGPSTHVDAGFFLLCFAALVHAVVYFGGSSIPCMALESLR